MTGINELAERLREWAAQIQNDATPSQVGPRAEDLFSIYTTLFALQAERDRLREALEPSAGTKAAYIGEFTFNVDYLGVDDEGDTFETTREITVPWTTVKEIMAAIRARAALASPEPRP